MCLCSSAILSLDVRGDELLQDLFVRNALALHQRPEMRRR